MDHTDVILGTNNFIGLEQDLAKFLKSNLKKLVTECLQNLR